MLSAPTPVGRAIEQRFQIVTQVNPVAVYGMPPRFQLARAIPIAKRFVVTPQIDAASPTRT